MTSNYWTSTQCNHWVLNHTQLAIARAEDLQYAESPEECTAIRIWLINCICLLTKRLSLRQRITATSIVFFHRFYSCAPGNSFASTDPALVATACVYVASKVEETPMHIRVVIQEAAKLWAELGHWKFPNDVSSLAEMEFYLLEDLHFHMIVYHPYRSLVALHSTSGKGATKLDASINGSTAWSNLFGNTTTSMSAGGANGPATPSSHTPIGSGDLGAASSSGFMDPDLAYGSPGAGLSGRKADGARAIENGDIEKIKQLDKQSQLRVMQEMIDERHRMFLYGGDNNMPLPRLEELDDQVLQMAWFVLNDTYRIDVILLYPPHVIAVAAIFLAIVLHDPSRERMMRSKRWMDDRRERYRATLLHPKDARTKHAAVKTHVSSTGGANGTSIVKPDGSATTVVSNTNTPPVLGASPPKPITSTMTTAPSPLHNVTSPPQQQPTTMTTLASSQSSRGPLRGFASLPPRPSHLPMKPGGFGANPPPPPPTTTTTQAHSLSQQSPSQQSPQIGASPAQTASPAEAASDGANAAQNLMPAIAAAAEQNAYNPPVPPPDAMTFLATLNVDLNAVAEIVQEMLSLYDLWHRISSAKSETANAVSTPTSNAENANHASSATHMSDASTAEKNGDGTDKVDATASINIGDGPSMFKRLALLRERRREDLVRNGAGL